MARYKVKLKGLSGLGGVDRMGAAHPELVPEGGYIEVGDDEGQTYDQTLSNAETAGHIEYVETKAKG